ncbi:conserved unknown protein [Ectocarpus siliculosus]|uniref:SGF29 C-terminal domain-containing protein n=1 Tax=Ectocarpus siliculosus TaxID=2880 RepID=D7FYG8_ECTSI|nr:conserved unknown protein [Ectocarpus siliculosus]|eukprot:CBJ32510.1 conserved unknown protein [Ectocarpus siliculosus]
MAYRGPMQEEATFVDDFMDGMTTMPNEIRRNSQLMRTLDKDAHGLSSELEALHNKFLGQAREKMKARGDSQELDPKVLVDDPPLMAEIDSLFSRTKQIVDEKVAIADQTHQMVADRLKRLTTDLASFEQTLHSQGEFDVGAAQPGDQVAFQEDPEADWVLGRVLSWMHETGQYEVMDEDDNSKKLTMDEHQVIPLEGRTERLSKGDDVLAVYVDTTSFYHATIAIPPRGRGQIGNGGTAHVQFVDDADEHGVTPHRAVPIIHIIKLPLGS